MKRARRLAIALLALAVVVAAMYTTGAFTSLTAERSADVAVAGDGSAFLALGPSSGPNGAFTSYGPDGALEVRLSGASTGATGVNPDSETAFADVFTITNKGTQPVSVWLTGGSDAVTFVESDGTPIESERGAVTLRPGGQPVHVGLRVETHGVEPGADLLKSVTVRTETGGASGGAPAAGRDGSDGSGGSTSGTTTASGEGGPILPIAGGVPGSLGDGRFYSVESPRDLSEADGPAGLAGAIARRIAPFGSLVEGILAQRGDEYEPPVVPVEETPITDAAEQDLEGSVPVAFRDRAEKIIHRVLESPMVADQSGEYRYMVGTYPSLDGWVAVWVRDETVVAVERGGQNVPKTTPPLQEPITLTRPDGRTVRIDPGDDSRTVSTPEVQSGETTASLDDLQEKGLPAVVGIAMSDSPAIGPADAVAVGLGIAIGVSAVAEVVDDLPPVHLPNPEIDAPEFHLPNPEIDAPEFHLPTPDIDAPRIDLPGWMPGSNGNGQGSSNDPLKASHTIKNPNGIPIHKNGRRYPKNAIDDTVLIPSDKSHWRGRKNHITNDAKIERIVEQADEVYTNGNGVYYWVLYENGQAKIVQGFNEGLASDASHNKITVNTVWKRLNNPRKYINDLINRRGLTQIHS